jgi:hypothetical protein
VRAALWLAGTGRATGAGAGLQVGEQLEVEFLVELGQLALRSGIEEFGAEIGHDAVVAQDLLAQGMFEFRVTSMQRVGEEVIWQTREAVPAWESLGLRGLRGLREVAAVPGAATGL